METNHRSGGAREMKFYFQSLMLLEVRIGNGEWENETENGKLDFTFFFVLDLLFIVRNR